MRHLRVFHHLIKEINTLRFSEPVLYNSVTFHIFNINLVRFCSVNHTSETLDKKRLIIKPQVENNISNLVSSDAVTSSPNSTKQELDLSSYGSRLLPTYNLAAYADKSVVLQELIKLGVELHNVEKNVEASQYLLQLNFEKDIKPYIFFLYDNGVHPDKLGKFITKNPLILKEDLRDLEVRINYLVSKNFTKEMISNILMKNPFWLSVPVRLIDRRLGYLQQLFKLSGDQVRKIITKVPGLATIKKKIIMVNTFALKEELNLGQYALKKLILDMPVLLRKDEYETVELYEYLTKIMKVPPYLILKQPQILVYRMFLLKERHQFLELLGRAQYNPLLPGYVSLTDLTTFSDKEFCEKTAKVSVLSYNEFLKTL